MASKEPEKEATLGEVLAEVSLADVGRILKGGSASIGCFAVYMVAILALISVTDAAGYGLDSWGIPDWLVWLLFVWLFVYAGTSQSSYHEWKMKWYFPKLSWLGSLTLAAYFVGFGYLLRWMSGVEEGFERGVAFFLIFAGYTSPFLLFLSVIAVGHANLVENRRADADAPRSAGGGKEA